MTAPSPPPAERARLHAAARQLEALVLKELVRASKAFTGGEGAGSAIRADLFADALADALARGGELGLARRIEETLGSGIAGTGNAAGALTRQEDVGPSPAEPTAGARADAVSASAALRKYARRADGVVEPGPDPRRPP